MLAQPLLPWPRGAQHQAPQHVVGEWRCVEVVAERMEPTPGRKWRHPPRLEKSFDRFRVAHSVRQPRVELELEVVLPGRPLKVQPYRHPLELEQAQLGEVARARR